MTALQKWGFIVLFGFRIQFFVSRSEHGVVINSASNRKMEAGVVMGAGHMEPCWWSHDLGVSASRLTHLEQHV